MGNRHQWGPIIIILLLALEIKLDTLTKLNNKPIFMRSAKAFFNLGLTTGDGIKIARSVHEYSTQTTIRYAIKLLTIIYRIEEVKRKHVNQIY